MVVTEVGVAREPGQHRGDRRAETRAWVIPFTPASVRRARTLVTVLLRHNGVAQRIIDDTRVVVSELLGNALRYARPISGGGLRLTLHIDDETVRVEVSDGGSATLPTLLHRHGLSVGGRGLVIVRTLTREWGVREGAAGNTVFGVLGRA
ncbi:MAG TPA: ATP-binding protein [Nocardioidaceae bacterium]|nr:ATP-binding protein [Nocardioidaceae bacterium]